MLRWSVSVVLMSAIAVGCSDARRKSDGDQVKKETDLHAGSPESAKRSGEKGDVDSNAGTSDRSKAIAKQREIIERVYGNLNLGDFSKLTPAWIRANLDPTIVQRAVGSDASWTVGEPANGEVRFEVAGNRRAGRVRISIPFAGLSENDMMMQAGGAQEMVKSGKAESMDIGVPGVLAIVREKSPSNLMLYTRDRMIVVDMARSGVGTNDAMTKKKAAVEIARAMLTRYRETHSKDVP